LGVAAPRGGPLRAGAGLAPSAGIRKGHPPALLDQHDDQRSSVDRVQNIDHLDKQPASINDPIAVT
jgi:hypothetical protein